MTWFKTKHKGGKKIIYPINNQDDELGHYKTHDNSDPFVAINEIADKGKKKVGAKVFNVEIFMPHNKSIYYNPNEIKSGSKFSVLLENKEHFYSIDGKVHKKARKKDNKWIADGKLEIE